jgi:hypothetical protein
MKALNLPCMFVSVTPDRSNVQRDAQPGIAHILKYAPLRFAGLELYDPEAFDGSILSRP